MMRAFWLGLAGLALIVAPVSEAYAQAGAEQPALGQEEPASVEQAPEPSVVPPIPAEPVLDVQASKFLIQDDLAPGAVIVTDGQPLAIEALQAAHARGEVFDLVISDIKMPDRNGYEVYRMAKSINASTPVVLMTGFGYDPHHCIVRASQEGLQSFLFKPFKASQLMDVLTKSLAAKG